MADGTDDTSTRRRMGRTVPTTDQIGMITP